jgi:hypothetical protein
MPPNVAVAIELTDEPRPRRPRTVTDEQVEAVIVKTLETTPKDATHWSTRSMAIARTRGIQRLDLGFVVDIRTFGTKVNCSGEGGGSGGANRPGLPWSRAVLGFRRSSAVPGYRQLRADKQSAFSRAPIIRMSRSARGVVRFGSPPVSKVETPPRTRQLDQCKPDRNPRPDPQTHTGDHGGREKACEGHTFHATPVTVGTPARRSEATEPRRAADGGEPDPGGVATPASVTGAVFTPFRRRRRPPA